jgi:hypothetical protein
VKLEQDMAKQDLQNILKQQPNFADIHIGIVENFQTISSVFSEPRWKQAEGTDGLQSFVRDVPVTNNNDLDALKIASAAKMIAREFINQERAFIVGENAVTVSGPLKDVDDNKVWRVRFIAG